jgi:PAS domain S-box-containing protein
MLSGPFFSSFRPSRLVAVAGSLLAALLLLAGTAALLERHLAAVGDARRETARLAFALASESAHSVREVDLAVKRLIEKSASAGVSTPASYSALMGTREVRETLADRLSGLPQLEALALISADGKLINSYGRWPLPDASLADRDYFLALKDAGAAIPFLGTPAQKGGAARMLPLARRVSGADGSFVGVVVALMDLRSLEEQWKEIARGEPGTIALLRQDGVFLLRLPQLRDPDAAPVASIALGALGERQGITVEGEGGDAALERVASARTVDEFPLVVTVGRSRAEIVGDWLAGAAIIAAGFGLSAAALLYATLLLFRQMASRERSDARRADGAPDGRSVLDGLKEVAFRTDADGRWTYLNPAWTEITGFPVAESLGRPFLAYVHPEDRDLNVECFQPLIRREREHCRHEIRYLTQDGGVRRMEVSARLTLDVDGEVTGTIGTLSDVSERHPVAGASAAGAMSAILEATLDHLDQGVMLVDAERTVAVCNRRAIEMLSLPAELTATRPSVDDVIDHIGRTEGFVGSDGPILDFIRSGGASGGPQLFEHVNGRIIEARSLPLPEGGAVRTFTDVTEARQAEAALRAATDEAEAASRSRSAFLATMSHEIRTPLNGVIGMTELLAETRLDGEQRNFASALAKSADHLLNVITDVLDIARLDAGEMELEAVPFDLAELVQHTVGVLSPRAVEKGLELVYTLDREIPDRLVGDPGRLRQVLLNLVGNAVKFTDHGTVAVKASRGQPDASGRVGITIEIADTGIGIAPDALASLFSDFGQIDTSISRRYGGAGLGLGISRRLVAAMGGEVRGESAPGAGATFTITLALPAAAEPEGQAELDAAAEPIVAGDRAPCVLLAEDNSTNQLFAAAILTRLGCEVDVVGDGREALGAVQRRAYDAVFMDMMMPEMDGLQATREFRALAGEPARVPVIALTANAFEHDREACAAAGMSGFVTKPVTAAKLREALSAALAPPAAGSAPGVHVLFDEDALAELRRTYGAAAPRFAGLFLKESLGRLQRIEDLVRRGDKKQLGIEAHTLKGSAMTFGCRAMQEAAAQLEAAAQNGASDRLPEYAAALCRAFEEVRDGLEPRLRPAA